MLRRKEFEAFGRIRTLARAIKRVLRKARTRTAIIFNCNAIFASRLIYSVSA